MLLEIQTFLFKETYLEISPKYLPFFLGVIELTLCTVVYENAIEFLEDMLSSWRKRYFKTHFWCMEHRFELYTLLVLISSLYVIQWCSHELTEAKWCIYASVNYAIIVSGNGLSPGRRQAIIWPNAGVLSIWPLGTNISEISIEIHIFSFKKMHL